MTKIMVIEDDSLVSRTLLSHLKKRGFEVKGAENGEEGLSIFREFQPDLVLLDVKLPDMNGLDVLRKIKAEDQEAAVIIMTAFDDMRTTVEAVKAGAFEYLVKPLDNLEIDLTIDKALQMKALEEKVSYLLEEKQKE
jgi:two-component system response regulator AtoC